MTRDLIARTTSILVVGVLLVAGSTPVAARPRPTPRPTPAPTATPRPRTLGDLARQMRLRHPAGTGQTLTITNENLPALAAEGGITTVTSSPATAATAPGLQSGGAGGASAAPGKEGTTPREAWRKRYSDQQEKVADMEKRKQELDSEIPALWNKFYAWDDPAYRDGVIKPKLDAAIRERDQLDGQLAEERGKLPEILDEARRAGAEPGWFRDLRQASPTPAPPPGP